MADDFDESIPAGTTQVNLSDNGIRTNWGQLITTIGNEHQFASGGSQTGVHSFGRDIEANRITDMVDGSIYFNTDRITGHTVIDVYDGGGTAWVEEDYVFVDIAQDWEAGQSGVYSAITSAGNSLDSVWTDSNAFSIVVSEDFDFENITGLPAGGSGTRTYEFTQDDPARNITDWGTKFRFPSGVAPDLTQTVGAIDTFYVTLMSDGNLLVTVSYDAQDNP